MDIAMKLCTTVGYKPWQLSYWYMHATTVLVVVAATAMWQITARYRAAINCYQSVNCLSFVLYSVWLQWIIWCIGTMWVSVLDGVNRKSSTPSYTGMCSCPWSQIHHPHFNCCWAFPHREESVEIIDSYQYPDVDDQFERPPYTVLLRCMLSQCGG